MTLTPEQIALLPTEEAVEKKPEGYTWKGSNGDVNEMGPNGYKINGQFPQQRVDSSLLGKDDLEADERKSKLDGYA